ncbi:MAG: cold shock domain-containing protein [Candidatus Zixiibacteriota bacterium]|nr:MAG: cold shock domain-containing protein [candidate division Zixibacteria bacterium]
MKGTVKALIRDKGFGFIKAEDGNEVFFHRSALQGVEFESLEEGTNVEFDMESGPKGPRAVSMKTV